MCGISGTIYNRELSLENLISIESLSKFQYQIINEELSESEILDLSWKLKSNSNFLQFCKNKKFKSKISDLLLEVTSRINKLSNETKAINRIKFMPKYLDSINRLQNLKDSHWFLKTEIQRWILDIEYLSNRKIETINDESILFLKDISAIIGSIDNKLELRGRDSLGITIQIELKEKYEFKKQPYYKKKFDANSNLEAIYDDDRKIIKFTFKTFNKIGALGENAKKIKEMIKSDKLFQSLLKNKLIESAIIISHTRWASVGKVNIENTHPIISRKIRKNNKSDWIGSILNGDIYNYKDYTAGEKNIKFDAECSTDCLAISNTIIGNKSKEFKTTSKSISNFSGSFAICIFGNQSKTNLQIFKQGTQGLYIGVSDDRIMFASDVYGLIEYCRYFYPVENNESFQMSKDDHKNLKNFEFRINTDQNFKIIKKENLNETNITTRDIDRKHFKHFLEKEIFDTEEITESTINRYIHNSQNPTDISNYDFILNENQIPNIIIKNIKKGKIKKIILTGMGTCYTAGIAISNFMREVLKITNSKILIETTVASEGSGFYLDSDMSDTLVIVIAQSGTTIDTNVYVKKAKERGALSLAIANKREGDVTFIVDGTLYIGEGRDIEISVPSTKTYTAQVIVGYVLALFIFKSIADNSTMKKIFNAEVKKLLKVPKLVRKTLNSSEIKKSIQSINKEFLKYKSWLVSYDNSENSVCANEIRIKLSENCYQAIPYLEIDKVDKLNIKNSFITLISNKKINNFEKLLLRILDRNNFVILINIKSKEIFSKKLNNYNNKTLFKISYEKAGKFYSFLPTILIGQLLSYHLAKTMDSRSQIFKNFQNSLINKKSQKKEFNSIRTAYKNGYFNIGISKKDINNLLINYNAKHKINLKLIDNLISQSRRTIDTIKHQAKTITVGAVRSENNEKIFDFQTNKREIKSALPKNFYDTIINSFSKNEADNIKLNSSENDFIYIKSSHLDEAHIYNIINMVSEIEKILNIKNIVKLAQPYDLDKSKNSCILNLIDSNNQKNKKNTLNFRNFKIDKTIKNILHPNQLDDYELSYHFWTICISILLVEKFIINKMKKNDSNFAREKFKLFLFRNFSSLKKTINNFKISSLMEKQFKSVAEIINKSDNLKCLGSGTNYNLAKFTSKKIMEYNNNACAFDILENHKHIDISAESNLIIFIANIRRKGYQSDALSEIQKIISHNNVPIIITSEDDNRFDQLYTYNRMRLTVIKIPIVPEILNSYLNMLIINRIMKKLKND